MENRVVDLEGSINFRDFGGYTTRSGRQIQRGRLYRCGALSELTSPGQAGFQTLNIEVICDLRRPRECLDEPTPFAVDKPRRSLIPIDPGSAVRMRAHFASSVVMTVAERIDYMREIYRELAAQHADDYGQFFSEVIHLGTGGLLVHCTAGKDRTGFGVALLQLALGVDRQTVMEDFLYTNEVIDFEGFILPRLEAIYGEGEVDVAAAKILSGVREEYLQTALGELEVQFGSLAAYFQHIGVGDREMHHLAATLLV